MEPSRFRKKSFKEGNIKMLDFKTLLPTDGLYSDWMEHTVEPYLSEHGAVGFFASFDHALIHYEYTCLPNAKGAVVISHGFTESAEKFREMAYWFLQMGYSVFALDHRGHGRSHRLSADFALTDVGSFSDYVRDLHCFVRRIVKPNSKGLPLYLYGHSMGGAISILYVQKYPSIFQKMILTSPMLKPKTAGIPAPITRTLSGFFRIVGKSNSRVFVSDEGFNENELFEDSPDTSKERFEYYRKKRVSFPYLQNSYPTYRWINESLRIGRLMLMPSRCGKIKMPLLLFSAGEDTLVYRKEQEIFTALVECGEIVYEERARHEIYMSTNDVMVDYLNKIQSFLSE